MSNCSLVKSSLAGSDTTATAIRATLLHILTNPRVHSKLLAEISSVSLPKNTIITDAQARRLPYLQAVVKEGLRIFPPVTGLMIKDVPPTGDEYHGVKIPPGTGIGYSAFGLSRNANIWGKDVDVFRPERWLTHENGGVETEEDVKERESALDLVFGYGRWQCLGRNVALIELNKVYFEVSLSSFLSFLFFFPLCPPSPSWPWGSCKADLRISCCGTLISRLLTPRGRGIHSAEASLRSRKCGLGQRRRGANKGAWIDR